MRWSSLRNIVHPGGVRASGRKGIAGIGPWTLTHMAELLAEGEAAAHGGRWMAGTLLNGRPLRTNGCGGVRNLYQAHGPREGYM